MVLSATQIITVSHDSDVGAARRAAKAMTVALAFSEVASEEVAVAASELASNLARHSRGGTLTLQALVEGERVGVQIESVDRGPGIPDVKRALTDGFSTAGSLGYGLGTVNRSMDELEIMPQPDNEVGTRIVCKRWRHVERPSATPCPLDFGVVTRAHLRMDINGDAFVLRRWQESTLVGVIDGLGHGQLAHRAAETARQYVESHFDQPLEAIFRGVGRACLATRGVVMALVRFDWGKGTFTFASIGNVESSVFGAQQQPDLVVRRGVIGLNAPAPVVTEHPWVPSMVLVLHTDGLKAHWRWADFPDLTKGSATTIAQRLLFALAKDDDDATVLVVKGIESKG